MPDLAAGQDLHMFAGVVRMRASGGEYQDVGEYSALTVTPDFETLQYNSRKHGKRTLVAEETTAERWNFELGLNSINATNFALALGGSVTEVTEGHQRVTMTSSTVTRDFQFEGTNDVGQHIDLHCTVQFRPQAAVDLAQDEWTVLTVGGQVVAGDDGGFGFWDFRDDVEFVGDPRDETA